MAELVDAPASGAGAGNGVEVRVLFRAPFSLRSNDARKVFVADFVRGAGTIFLHARLKYTISVKRKFSGHAAVGTLALFGGKLA